MVYWQYTNLKGVLKMVESGTYVVGGEKNQTYKVLKDWKRDAFMEVRFSEQILDVCTDIYFATYDGDELLSRIWMSYGHHPAPVSNWGAVYTNEAHRGKGYCTKTLDYCFEEIPKLQGPVALMCTASEGLTKVYGRYGFVPALRGATYGPLYRPLGDSPKTFQEFCEAYFTETDELYIVKADFGWRNEVDCLLRFALRDLGENLEIKGVDYLADLLLETPERAKVILTGNQKCVGWMVDDEMQLHPKYRNVKKFTCLSDSAC